MVYTFHYALIVWYNGGGRDGHGYGARMVNRNIYMILVTIADWKYHLRIDGENGRIGEWLGIQFAVPSVTK